MNLKKRLRHLAQKLNDNPKYGKTSLLAKITKELDGVLITSSTEEATFLQRQHKGLTAKSMDINLDNLSGPFFLDHHAAVKLLQRAADKIELLETELKKYQPKPNVADTIETEETRQPWTKS